MFFFSINLFSDEAITQSGISFNKKILALTNTNYIMIRRYTKEDKEGLIELLKLNTPKFFDPSEEEDFIGYLEKISENYFVVEDSKKVIGGGGINYGFDNGKTARISWDMLHPAYHGKGIGSQLTKYRIDEIKKNSEVEKIVVRTSQLAYEFYQKNGFQLEKIEKDYWAKGFDLYLMKIEN